MAADSDTDLKWTYETGQLVTASPTVVEDTVYIGSWDFSVYALDPNDGTQQWSFETGNEVRSAVAVADDTVYVGSVDDHVYALDATSGDELWAVRINNSRLYSLTGSPTVADGTVYIANGNGDLYALNPTDGTEQWVKTLSEESSGITSPTVANDTIYVGRAAIPHKTLPNQLLALDTEDGTQQWAFETADQVSSLTVADGTVYYGDNDGNIVAVDAEDGTKQWSFETDGYFINSGPAVADGTVYFGSDDSSVYALDAEDGTKQWSFETGNEVTMTSTVGDGTLFVGDRDGRVYALDVAGIDSPSSTQTPTSTQTSTSIQTSTVKLSGRFADATIVGKAIIENETYFILQEIPDESPDKHAFVNTEMDLLEPTLAVDVAVSYTFAENYPFDSRERLAYTNEQYERFENVEFLARTANILAELSGALALVTLDPKASISNSLDALRSVIEWNQTDLSEPYAEQYTKMAAMGNNIDWIDVNVPDPSASFSSTTPDTLAVAQTLLDSSIVVDATDDLVASASTVRDIIEAADSISDVVSPGAVNGVDDLRSDAFTAGVGLATEAAVGTATNIAENQAKIGALGAGNAAARRPLLNEIISLEERLRADSLAPAGIIRLQTLRQTDYQLESAAHYGIAHLQEELSTNLLLGRFYDAIFNTDGQADLYYSNGEAFENLSHLTIAATGREFERGLERYLKSANYDEYGGQEVFDYR